MGNSYESAGFNGMRELSQQEATAVFRENGDIPGYTLLKGTVTPDFFYMLSNEGKREYGSIITPSGKRVIKGSFDDKRFAPPVTDLLQVAGEREALAYLHTHVNLPRANGDESRLPVPSDTDYRVNGTGFRRKTVKRDYLVAENHCIEFHAGDRYEDEESQIFLDFFGKKSKDFFPNDANIAAELSRLRIKMTGDRNKDAQTMSWAREQLGLSAQVEWKTSVITSMSEADRRRLQIYTAQQFQRNTPESGKSFVRVLSEKQFHQLLNPTPDDLRRMNR